MYARNASNLSHLTMETVISVTVKPTMNTVALPANVDTTLLMTESVKLWNWAVLDINEDNALIAFPIIN